MQKLNLLGKTFGRWTIVGDAPSRNGAGYWRAKCKCGNTKIVSTSHLNSGASKSCGCMQKEGAKARAISNSIGGYKGYRKYKTVADILLNTTKVKDCLEWNGSLFANGYAKVGKTDVFTTPLLHRNVFSMVHGYMPVVVMHTCDNRKCINPKHLKGGTQQENIQDMHSKGRGNKK